MIATILKRHLAPLFISLSLLFLCVPTSFLGAQGSNTVELGLPHIEFIFYNEPPLTHADIEFYIAAMEHVLSENSKEKLIALADEHGISELRAGFVLVKVGLGLVLLDDPSARAAMIERIGCEGPLPTADEMQLLTDRREELFASIAGPSEEY
ncbi:MAG: hypothetical protein LBE38_08295 [Deltaproteobacteria bacterium]|jgi:hypothetical protein|nr:hypothetical protein [Deltaproteobacteria bacterium]